MDKVFIVTQMATDSCGNLTRTHVFNTHEAATAYVDSVAHAILSAGLHKQVHATVQDEVTAQDIRMFEPIDKTGTYSTYYIRISEKDVYTNKTLGDITA